jgi:hypothetical protein
MHDVILASNPPQVRCPRCTQMVFSATLYPAALLSSLSQWQCLCCHQVWSEVRTRHDVTRYWEDDRTEEGAGSMAPIMASTA